MILKQPKIYYFLFIAFSFVMIGLGIALGSTSIPLSHVIKSSDHMFHTTFSPEWSKSTELIVWEIRAPRVFLAFLVGSALSLAGAAFQGLLRNPLADPDTLGVSSGASLGAVIAIYFHLSITFLGMFNVPFFAFIGALASLFLVYGLSRLGNRMMIETLILSGIIISSFIGAFISLIVSFSGQELRQIIFWLMGSVSMRDWNHVVLFLPIIMISFLILMWKSKDLNVMAFGDRTAQYLGVDIEKSKKWILIAASLLTAVSVSVSGVVVFVGLVMPHLVRLLIGPNHVHLLPISMLSGGIFLVIADTLARNIIEPSEIPLGVITALIGAPVFTSILIQRHRKREVGVRVRSKFVTYLVDIISILFCRILLSL